MKFRFAQTKIACYSGLVVQAVVNNFLPILFIALQDVYGLDYEKLARLILVNFVTQIVTDLCTPKIVKALGYRRAAELCQFTAALGLILLGILPRIMNNKLFAIAFSVMVYAVGSGLMEVILSPMIELLPTSNKEGNMSVLHSFYCWGQVFTVLVTTLLVKVFGYGKWFNIPIIWSVLPLINMFAFFKVPIIQPNEDKKDADFSELFKIPKFKIYMVMMLCAGACEIAMAQWASLFAQKALGVTKIVGDIAGPCAFAVLMGIGRIWYAAVSQKLSFKKILIVLNILCFISYITVAFCKIPVIALIFCAICGFTVSVSWPGIYSLGAKEFPNGGPIMYSVFAMCGDGGCSLGPWLLGIVANIAGLNIGFAAASVFPVIMVICTVLSMRKKDCKTV